MTRPGILELAARGPVHFVGVGGAGMAPLAELVLRSGGRVTGCDLREGPATVRLRELGVPLAVGHDPVHVTEATAVVVTAAVPPGHPELQAARDRGIPVLKRARALGELVSGGRVVAVAGTHGKTTTTALATEVLAEGGLDPTALVGGPVPAWGGNLRAGGRELFVVEADEYDRSFHMLEPDVAVVTNLEADHLDVYGDLQGVREAFRGFLARIRPGARVAVCADDPGASRLLTALPVAGYTYGLSAGSQLRAVEVETGPSGTRCRVLEEGRSGPRLNVRLPGLHNLRNALAAAAVGRHLGLDWNAVVRGVARFSGVGRRFQRLGTAEGITVVDDYAHHPTEISATLTTLREAWPDRRLVAVFQPHLFTRTRDFAEGFGAALAAADLVWITDVYPAREAPLPGVTGELVARAARARAGAGVDVRYHESLDDLPEAVIRELRDGDVVVTMGAGSVEAVGPALLTRLREAAHA